MVNTYVAYIMVTEVDACNIQQVIIQQNLVEIIGKFQGLGSAPCVRMIFKHEIFFSVHQDIICKTTGTE